MNTPADILAAAAAGRRITMVTCYDSWSARIIAATDIDLILVGDSVAMVVHGHTTTIPADLDMMCLHTAAVRRGAPEGRIIADMPFLAHRKGLAETVTAVERLVRAGAQAVKLEGADGNIETIRHVVESGVGVMGHLGLTPQSIHKLGGFRVQARDHAAAAKLLEDALALQEAGCFALVLECVPSTLAREVTEALHIPTIGIGAGPHTSGQVLVLQDLLGVDPSFRPRFVRTYLDGHSLIREALEAYDRDVKAGAFPSDEESFS
ncbi:MAG TPA: 3-methyl-2-oxobutanoate hydroxymethyltransferase [Methylomirabilota bacterium]|nr:3-methyl-2-oxobutanoate hydroxymethyltransferase [Methylomirabilota bacterium]